MKIKQLLAACQTPTLLGLHLSDQRFIINFLFAMIEARQVQLHQIAAHFTSAAGLASRLRRMQCFFSDSCLDKRRLAYLIMKWLPAGNLTLCLDQAIRRFDSLKINMLTLPAAYRKSNTFFRFYSKKVNSFLAIHFCYVE